MITIRVLNEYDPRELAVKAYDDDRNRITYEQAMYAVGKFKPHYPVPAIYSRHWLLIFRHWLYLTEYRD